MICSFWACFGGRGGEYATGGVGGCFRCLDGAPQESVVGVWRSLDAVLVLVVLGCAITTGLVEGYAREVVHAIQVGGCTVPHTIALFAGSNVASAWKCGLHLSFMCRKKKSERTLIPVYWERRRLLGVGYT